MMRPNVHSYTRTAEPPTAGSPSEAPFYADDLLPELQSTLATLADLDVGFEIARDSLEEWSGSEEEKERCRAEIEQAYRQAREPYLRRLTQLQEWFRPVRFTH
jgi:hypothetical protein